MCVVVSLLNHRAAGHWKLTANASSAGGEKLNSVQVPSRTTRACVCHLTFTHYDYTRALICVCVATYLIRLKVCQLWSFFARLCGTQQMCSVLPWGCRLSLSLFTHSHLARSSVRTLQCLYIAALQIISWLQYLSCFLPLVTSLISLLLCLSLVATQFCSSQVFCMFTAKHTFTYKGAGWQNGTSEGSFPLQLLALLCQWTILHSANLCT